MIYLQLMVFRTESAHKTLLHAFLSALYDAHNVADHFGTNGREFSQLVFVTIS